MIRATIMPIKGVGPCRTTKLYTRESSLALAIKRECQRLRMPGPYLVTRYDGERMIESRLED